MADFILLTLSLTSYRFVKNPNQALDQYATAYTGTVLLLFCSFCACYCTDILQKYSCNENAIHYNLPFLLLEMLPAAVTMQHMKYMRNK